MATATTIYQGELTWYKLVWTNADVVALPTTNGQITIATLPAKTLVKRAFIQITGQGAGPATFTVSVGPAGSLIGYVIASSAKAAANTIYGDALAELGTSLSGLNGAIPSITGTTVIQADFTSVGANLSTVTGSAGIVWLEAVVLP